jgi:hypothetical protein
MAARDPPPTESMVSDQETPAPACDRQHQARLVGAVLGYPRSRGLLANLLLGGDVGHLALASKSAFKLLVLRLPAMLPSRVSKVPVSRLCEACRPIAAWAALSWPGARQVDVRHDDFFHLMTFWLFVLHNASHSFCQEFVANLPGVGAPVMLGLEEIAPANPVYGLESLTINLEEEDGEDEEAEEAFSYEKVALYELVSTSSLANLLELVLGGGAASGDIAALQPLGMLRNLSITNSPDISGNCAARIIDEVLEPDFPLSVSSLPVFCFFKDLTTFPRTFRAAVLCARRHRRPRQLPEAGEV